MTPADPAVTVERLRQFLKLHATCAGIVLDTPELPGSHGYRAVVACRCGDTAEYWVTDALLTRQHLPTALAPRRVA